MLFRTKQTGDLIRNVLIFGCLIGFTVTLTGSVHKLLAKPTGVGFEMKSSYTTRYPAITVCSMAFRMIDSGYNPGDKKDIIAHMGDPGDLADIWIEPYLAHDYGLSTKLDLRNADDLAILNTTIDEVWAKDIKLSVDETMSIKNMDKCFTITLPEHVYTTGHTFELIIDFTKVPMVHIGANDVGQETPSYETDWTNVKFIKEPKNKSTMFLGLLMTLSKSKNLNMPDKPCRMDNSVRKNRCLDDYYTRTLGCHLPWKFRRDNSTIRNCSNTEDMEAYTRILTNFLMNKEYYDTECKIPNCEKSQWKVEEFFHDFELSFLEEKQGKVYLLHLDKNVMVTNQIPLYGFSSFVSDVGGNMGLLLGASLPSIYDFLAMKFTQVKKELGTK